MGRMRNDPEGRGLKQQLPFPYNQDLSKVLRGLKRRALKSRARQANDPVTAAYLCAAVRLIQRHLGPGTSRELADVQDPDSIARPLLSFLSQRAVSAEVAHNPPPFHRMGSQRTMRDRWEPHSHFIADVLRFCLWAWHYPAQHTDEAADARDEVIRGPDPVRGLHRLCYWDLTRMLDTPAFRLGVVAAAAAEGDPVVSETISGRHRENSLLWKHFYEEILQARGLRVRAGVTLDDCVILLGAVADGLALRALADPAAPVIDRARRRTLLGTAALALMAGCLERADHGEGRPLDEAVHAMMSGPAPDHGRGQS